MTARPRPIREIATYSARFIVAKISASATTGRHCRPLNDEKEGRMEQNSTAAATHCLIATTPAGPSTGNARAAVAAPTWLDAALPVMSAMPVIRDMGTSLRHPELCAKCINRRSYTLWLWISS